MNPDTEKKIAQTAFYWKDYNNYGSEQKAIKAFSRRKGMNSFSHEIIRTWLLTAVEVRMRLDFIKAELEEKYDQSSHVFLTEAEFIEATKTLENRLNSEYPKLNITVSYMITMAWRMYYYR